MTKYLIKERIFLGSYRLYILVFTLVFFTGFSLFVSTPLRLGAMSKDRSDGLMTIMRKKTPYGSQQIDANEDDLLDIVMRAQQIKSRCKGLEIPDDMDNLTLLDIPRKLLVSDRYQLMACKAEKVASTNLQRIFYVLEKFTNSSDTGRVKQSDARKVTQSLYLKQSNYTLEEMKFRLSHYRKFMLIRHPLERLISAFRDHKPIKLFAGNKKLTFKKFLTSVLQTPNLTRPAKPLYQICNPCKIQYDFVGSLDSFSDDIETLLEEIHATEAVTIPRRNETGYTQNRSSSLVEKYFENIPLNTIEMIENMFEMDYVVFGFTRYKVRADHTVIESKPSLRKRRNKFK